MLLLATSAIGVFRRVYAYNVDKIFYIFIFELPGRVCESLNLVLRPLEFQLESPRSAAERIQCHLEFQLSRILC